MPPLTTEAPRLRTWDEIAQDPAYLALPPARQENVRAGYFQDVILPSVPRGEEETAWEQFTVQTVKPSRGWMGDIGSSLATGLAVDLPEMGGRALRTLDPEGGVDVARRAGTALVEGAKHRAATKSWAQPSKESDTSIVRRAVTGGVRSAPVSVAAGLPGAVAGGLLGGAPGLIAGFAGSGGTVFGLAEYDRFREEAEAAGVPPAIARDGAVKAAFLEGGLEAASNVLSGLTLGVGKVAQQPLKSTVKEVLKPTVREAVKRTAMALPFEVGTEVAQEAGGAKLRQDVGIPTIAPAEAAKEAIGPSVVMTALFGAGAHGLSHANRLRVQSTLANPKANPDARAAAAAQVASGLQQANPGLADTWLTRSMADIQAGRAIPLDEDLSTIKPPPVIPPEILAARQTLSSANLGPAAMGVVIANGEIANRESLVKLRYQMMKAERGASEEVRADLLRGRSAIDGILGAAAANQPMHSAVSLAQAVLDAEAATFGRTGAVHVPPATPSSAAGPLVVPTAGAESAVPAGMGPIDVPAGILGLKRPPTLEPTVVDPSRVGKVQAGGQIVKSKPRAKKGGLIQVVSSLEGKAPPTLGAPVAPESEQGRVRSLTDVILAAGGIKPLQESYRGEDRYFSVREGGMGLLRAKTGKTWDQLRERAVEAGVIPPDMSLPDFIAAARHDMDDRRQGGSGVHLVPESIPDPDFSQMPRPEVTTGDLDLEPGDQFTVDGERFAVEGRDNDGNLIIKDGETFHVDDTFGKIPMPDEGSVKRGERRPTHPTRAAGEITADLEREPEPPTPATPQPTGLLPGLVPEKAEPTTGPWRAPEIPWVPPVSKRPDPLSQTMRPLPVRPTPAEPVSHEPTIESLSDADLKAEAKRLQKERIATKAELPRDSTARENLLYQERRRRWDEKMAAEAARQEAALAERGLAIGDRVEMWAPSMLGGFGGKRMTGVVKRGKYGNIYVLTTSDGQASIQNPWKKVAPQPTASARTEPPGNAAPQPGALLAPAPPTPPQAEPAWTSAPHEDLSKTVSGWLTKGHKITADELHVAADAAFGGTPSEGKYTPMDVRDAMEMGVNRYLASQMTVNPGNRFLTVEKVKEMVDGIREAIMDKIPLLPNRRTAEQEEFQQFSTPPDLAYVMAWLANPKKGDMVLEPSAGTGSLAQMAKNTKATVVVNELSPRRAEILRQLYFDPVFTENAEQLNNILPKDIRPTVVLMNPPFSSTAGRMEGQRTSRNAQVHIEQALKRLEPGGRLVALVGDGIRGFEGPTKLWDELATRYRLRASIGVSGEGYKKYGTTFDNRILVFDKLAPTGEPAVTGRVDDIKDAIHLLEGVRNDRQDVRTTDRLPEQTPDQPRSDVVVEGGERGPGVRGTGQAPRHQPDVVGVGGEEGGVRPTSNQRPLEGHLGRDVGAEPEAGPRLPDERTGRPGSRSPAPETVGVTGGRGKEVAATPGLNPPGGEFLTGELSTDLSDLDLAERVTAEAKTPDKPSDLPDAIYDSYRPKVVRIAGSKPHPTNLVESSAMAATDSPVTAYVPNLPQSLIERGVLSDAQLEPIALAGEAHSIMLPGGFRKGFFIGDGTGTGKGRELAGIILDNWRQGRRKAVWITEKPSLIAATLRDWGAMGQSPTDVKNLSKVSLSQDVKGDSGILFTTYSTLASGFQPIDPMAGDEGPKAVKDTKKRPRMDQILDWLGPSFDGVVVFDEAHNMQNNVSMEGSRGKTTPSNQALAGLEFQNRMPKARIVYASATGATNVEGFGYASRLGLWGEGTAFPSKSAFIGKISAGGLGAMEIVARDIKSDGAYISRGLSYDGVTYGQIEHQLTPDQREVYSEVAKAWQIILQNMEAILVSTGAAKNGRAKSAARSKFWGSQQRFFNQMLTSMQMPSVIADVRSKITDGHAAVLQLVNTNEASSERELERKKEEGEDLEDLDLTPRQNLMEYLKTAFPVQAFEKYTDENGNDKSRPVFDSTGNPVEDAEAVAKRDELLDTLGSIRVPDGPLEALFNAFGHEKVAEVTGRSRRVVRVQQPDGSMRNEIQKRGPVIAAADGELFNDDKKQILVFSGAGGTGRSYHSDLGFKNQRRRFHYLVQAGWQADRAVQGFGRTHRTNEANQPHYALAMTDLKGHKRFMSSIARRLDQLGALTKGQRQTGSQGLFSSKDNLEGPYAAGAIRSLILDGVRGQINGLSADVLTDQLGFKSLIDANGSINETKMPAITQFLNRILILEPDHQNLVFDEFFQRMSTAIDMAMANGELDTGLENFHADKVTRTGSKVVYEHPRSKSTTSLTDFEAQHRVKTLPYVEASSAKRFKGVYRNLQSGKLWAVSGAGTKTLDNGAVIEQLRLRGQAKDRFSFIPERELTDRKFARVPDDEAQAAWNKALNELPTHTKETVHLLTGSLLPIWDRLPEGNSRVMRIQADDGKRYIGRLIHEGQLDMILERLGIEGKAPTITPAEGIQRIIDDGVTLELANGWKVERRTVGGEPRIEITGDLFAARNELLRHGVFSERIASTTRYFIPTGENAAGILEKVIERRPVVKVRTPSRSIGTVSEDAPAYGAASPAPIFFSQLRRVVEAKMPNAAPATVVKRMLESPQSGVKADELKWTGLDDFLTEKKAGKVTKQEVLDFLAQHEVQVEEVEKSDKQTNVQLAQEVDRAAEVATHSQAAVAMALRTAMIKDGSEVSPHGVSARLAATLSGADVETERYQNAMSRANTLLYGESSHRLIAENVANWQALRSSERAVEADEQQRKPARTKFASYQLPGGKDGTYRELLLTLPVDQNKAAAIRSARVKELIADRDRLRAERAAGVTPTRHDDLERQIRNAEMQIDMTMKSTVAPNAFRGGHFDEPNVLAHVRFNEREGAAIVKPGGPTRERILFIEEVQSDFHQKGKREGYGKNKYRVMLPSEYASGGRVGDTFNDEAAARAVASGHPGAWVESVTGGVPDAPFKKTWHELALKRMLRYAAEHGYDKVAWTTGEIQNERYDLSKHVKAVRAERIDSGSKVGEFRIDFTDINGKESTAGVFPAEKLPDVVGKDLSEKIVGEADKYPDGHEYSGLDLKVGGEGMKGFYDQILPAFLSKYGKKWGTKVGTTALGAGGIVEKNADGSMWIIHRPGEADRVVGLNYGDTPQEVFKEWFGKDADKAVPVHSIDITPAMKKSVLEEGQSLFERPNREYTGEHGDQSQERAQRDSDAAVADLSRPHRVSALRRAVTDLATGVRTLGKALADAITTGRVDLRGQTVRSADDLAVLAQVYRDPRFETFRVFYLKGDTIVSHVGVSSRAVGSSAAFTEEANAAMLRMRRRMQRFGADGYYILHNHPSGDPNPSSDDVLLTRRMRDAVPGFRGHVVIDHKTYARIEPDLSATITTMPTVTGKDPLRQSTQPHPMMGLTANHPDRVAEIGRALRTPDEFATIFYTDSQLKVVAIQEVPLTLFSDTRAITPYIRGQAQGFGSAHALTHYIGPVEKIQVYERAARVLTRELVLLDAVTDYGPRMGLASSAVSERDLIAETRQERGTHSFGVPVQNPGIRVYEQAAEYAATETSRGMAPKWIVDRLFRLPFARSLDADGRWQVGVALHKAVVEYATAKDTEGRYPKVDAFLKTVRTGLVDKYGLPESYVGARKARELERNAISLEGIEAFRQIRDLATSDEDLKALNTILVSRDTDPGAWAALSEPIRNLIVKYGQEMVDSGILSPEAFERNKGAYLHRTYEKYRAATPAIGYAFRKIKLIGKELKGRGKNEYVKWEDVDAWVSGAKDGNTWRLVGKGRGAHAGQALMNRDWTKAEREKMGEVEDAAYNVAMTFDLIAKDLSTGKLYQRIANDQLLASKEPVEGWIHFGNEQIPKSQTAKWGALADHYVHPDVARDLKLLEEYSRPTFWRWVLTQWKVNKTARNPVVHVNNIISNLFLADMHDLGAADLVSGLQSYRTGDRYYTEARAAGVFGHNLIGAEIKPFYDPSIAQKAKSGDVAATAMSMLKKGDAAMVGLYSKEDDVMRMALYKKLRLDGKSVDEAAHEAIRQFIDYNISAPWIVAGRNTVLPFISYSYRAIPLIAEVALTRPWKLLKYYALFAGLEMLAEGIAGIDADDARELLPERQQGRTWFGAPKQVLTGKHFLDISRYAPGADVFDLQGQGAIPLPAPLNIGGPLDIGGSFLRNRDPFTGNPIRREGVPPERQARDVSLWIWRQMGPNAPWVPYSYSWDKIAKGWDGAVDATGQPARLATSVASTLGVKVRPFEAQSAVIGKTKELRRQLFEARLALNQAKRRFARQDVSRAQFESVQKEQMEIIQDLSALIGKAHQTAAGISADRKPSLGAPP